MGMINFKGFIKSITDGVKEVKENKKYTNASDKKTKKMKKKLINKVSKKDFIKENGEMNYNKSQDTGSILNPNQSKYKKTKKKVEKKYENLG